MQVNALLLSRAVETRIDEDGMEENREEETWLMDLCRNLRMAGVGSICILMPYKAEAYRRRLSRMDIEVMENVKGGVQMLHGFSGTYRMLHPGSTLLVVEGIPEDCAMQAVRVWLSQNARAEMDLSQERSAVQLLQAILPEM